MASYTHWTLLANRWAACVNYGSPISAWTSEMHTILKECGGDTLAAGQELCRRRAARQSLKSAR